MLKNMLKFWKMYFVTNPKRLKPILLLIFIISLDFSLVYLNVQFNEWRNDFYNALQNVDYPSFTHNIKKFTVLALIFVGIIGYKLYMMQKLQISWREWMTKAYVDKWLNSKMYYGLQFLPQAADNIDQRISEDINNFVQLSLSLTLGLISSVTTFCSFIFILWTLSDAMSFVVFGHPITIGHYLVWAVLLYSVFGTYITRVIGKPLAGLNYEQELLEATFRYSLIRVRENSESVALFKGENFENAKFSTRFGRIVGNFNKINTKQKHLTWWGSYFAQIAVIFPYLVNAPRFFSGAIKLGGLMQAASAFDSVQSSLGWMVDSYTNLASFRAVINRLQGFETAIDGWKDLEDKKDLKITGGVSMQGTIATDAFALMDLTVNLPNGTALIQNQNTNFLTGRNYLISGASGSGKSTLLRAFAGLWPYASGTIYFPIKAKKMFISQSSYIPLGTLLDVIGYPSLDRTDINHIVNLLLFVGLDDLVFKLNEEADWSKVLSGGQKQKIAFIRAVLQKPDVLFIDEGTSAMDQYSEEKAYELLSIYLPDSTIVSVGHRSTIDKYHHFKINLESKRLVPR